MPKSPDPSSTFPRIQMPSRFFIVRLRPTPTSPASTPGKFFFLICIVFFSLAETLFQVSVTWPPRAPSVLPQHPLHCPHVTKPPSRTSRTALRRPIRFLLRRPNRRQDRRSLRRLFPENLITCIVTLIPHVTHHMQSSRDSQLSRFHEVSELLSQPPPVSICKILSHASFSHCTVAQFP